MIDDIVEYKDIDKSYMMGTEIDSNGLYQGWSDLFVYDTEETLRASEELPYPNGKKYEFVPFSEIGDNIENTFNIHDYVIRYLQITDDVERLKLYNEMLRAANLNSNVIKVVYNNPETVDIDVERARLTEFQRLKRLNPEKSDAEIMLDVNINPSDVYLQAVSRLISILNLHNLPGYSLDKISSSLKNFISQRLLKVIQGTRNFIGAYSPISMDDLHEAADSSSSVMQVWTVMNPGYIGIMLTQNMVGKKGVGIAANGQKASFIWKYWMTNAIRYNTKYKTEVQFPEGFSIDRVEGRYKGTPENIVIRRLPDINMEGASAEDIDIFSFTREHYLTSDLAASQMISAATDNAKELILARINANTDLSKMYMYLITLGFDVKDIVSFMTSPAIDLIAKSTDSNIFLHYKPKTIDVAQFILNKISKVLNPEFKTIRTPSLTQPRLIDSKTLVLIKNSTTEQLKEMEADIQEFIRIYRLSEEFSKAGRLLGLNQGVASTKENLLGFKSFIKSILIDREKVLPAKFDASAWWKQELGITDNEDPTAWWLRQTFGIEAPPEEAIRITNYITSLVTGSLVESPGKDIENQINRVVNGRRGFIQESLKQLENISDMINLSGETFDFDRWLSDDIYRDWVVKYYNAIKGSLNVFGLIEETPHFRSVLSIYNYLNSVDLRSSILSQLLNYYYDVLLKQYSFATPEYAMQLVPVLEKFVIRDFLNSNPLSIGILTGWSYINSSFLVVPFAEELQDLLLGKDPNITSDNAQITSFIYLMHKHIIPYLKEKYGANEFIRGLVKFVEDDKYKYKLNINMRAVDTNAGTKVQFQRYLRGLEALSKISLREGLPGSKGEGTLADLFMLYNLVINLNLEGADKMTAIFSEFISRSDNQDNILKKYLAFVGNEDYKGELVDRMKANTSLNDILLAAASTFTSAIGRREPIIKMINTDTGMLEYFLNIGFEKYNSMGDKLPIVSGEEASETMARIRIRELYGFLPAFTDYINNLIKNLQDTGNIDIWSLTLDLAQLNGYIRLDFKCV